MLSEWHSNDDVSQVAVANGCTGNRLATKRSIRSCMLSRRCSRLVSIPTTKVSTWSSSRNKGYRAAFIGLTIDRYNCQQLEMLSDTRYRAVSRPRYTMRAGRYDSLHEAVHAEGCRVPSTFVSKVANTVRTVTIRSRWRGNLMQTLPSSVRDRVT